MEPAVPPHLLLLRLHAGCVTLLFPIVELAVATKRKWPTLTARAGTSFTELLFVSLMKIKCWPVINNGDFPMASWLISTYAAHDVV